MPKPKILIVDDDKDFTDKLEEFLHIPFDCDVIVRNQSNGVVYVVKDDHVDVLIQDIHVPGPDGFEVAKRLKDLGINIEVFLVTSWKEDAYNAKSADLGAHFLPKPIDYKMFQKRLTEFFEQKGFDYKKK